MRPRRGRTLHTRGENLTAAVIYPQPWSVQWRGLVPLGQSTDVSDGKSPLWWESRSCSCVSIVSVVGR